MILFAIKFLLRFKSRWTWHEYAVVDEELARLIALQEKWDDEDAREAGAGPR